MTPGDEAARVTLSVNDQALLADEGTRDQWIKEARRVENHGESALWAARFTAMASHVRRLQERLREVLTQPAALAAPPGGPPPKELLATIAQRVAELVLPLAGKRTELRADIEGDHYLQMLLSQRAAPSGGGGRLPLLTDKEGEEAVDMFHRLQREENPYALTMVIEHFRQRAAPPETNTMSETTRGAAMDDGEDVLYEMTLAGAVARLTLVSGMVLDGSEEWFGEGDASDVRTVLAALATPAADERAAERARVIEECARLCELIGEERRAADIEEDRASWFYGSGLANAADCYESAAIRIRSLATSPAPEAPADA